MWSLLLVIKIYTGFVPVPYLANSMIQPFAENQADYSGQLGKGLRRSSSGCNTDTQGHWADGSLQNYSTLWL